MNDSLKVKYPYAKSIAYLSFLIGIYGTYFAHGYIKAIPIILSVVGVLYYVFSEHHKIDVGDELEKKIYLEALSFSFNTLIVTIWCLILIDINLYRLGDTKFLVLYFIGMFGI